MASKSAYTEVDSLLGRRAFSETTGDLPAYTALLGRFDTATSWRNENPDAPISAKMIATLQAIVTDLAVMEWGVEQTTSRRAAWNALARAGVGALACQEQTGIVVQDLQAAIKRLGL